MTKIRKSKSSKKNTVTIKALYALLCALLLTACTNSPAVQDIPPSYFTCRSWPEKLSDDATDVQSGEYIIRGHGAWRSCKDALAKLNGIGVKSVIPE